ncbi:TorF family putative porin [Bradyrhizobium sp. ISRA443]|uniref:TorF family putative porin n=1 Tax=unclassified Bradyrhizobium TaxID=2631580 RepID=UPI00247AE895|nr:MULTISPECIES: TorF family putative porin [unclassified Bradyrhizobium]WGR95471.1 TorF family putative porin [Bradyrhizobium sp. ISRA435]WGS00498.1 TorF family putative porin [Bradyrhizobium sp. ISRA436]WGS07387.1 TorF family putative porin [Bradyrhizobium sp. ISRA437]WGS14272.1 TorF family putative porin [Bradyrhizobium sp. ISRA443]
MKKLALLATALAMVSSSALAADMAVKAVKAPPPAPFEPWDVAFGSSLSSDYIFRGVTQSNHKPSVSAYFEPRYNVTKDLQLYVGVSGESISFANRAAAEVDVYGGIRPTFGAFAFDIGVWGYLYPGGTCQFGAPFDTAGNPLGPECATNFLANGNVMKRDVSFFEVYGKVTYTINDNWAFTLNEYYSPNFLNTGAWGNYSSIIGKYTAPSTIFGSSGVGMYVSGEFGRQWLGTSDSFYGVPAFPNGIKYADYNTWNIGIGFTYKVFTLDLRYSDTDMSKGDCNAFTSDFTAGGTTNVTPINPSGLGSNWCGAAGIAKLSVDLTAASNLK